MFVDSGYRLENKNDYHSFLVGKQPIVVRDDAIYDNVCDHRLSLIHPLGYGNQKFVIELYFLRNGISMFFLLFMPVVIGLALAERVNQFKRESIQLL